MVAAERVAPRQPVDDHRRRVAEERPARGEALLVRGEHAVGVDDALGRAGRARGEQHLGDRVGREPRRTRARRRRARRTRSGRSTSAHRGARRRGPGTGVGQRRERAGRTARDRRRTRSRGGAGRRPRAAGESSSTAASTPTTPARPGRRRASRRARPAPRRCCCPTGSSPGDRARRRASSRLGRDALDRGERLAVAKPRPARRRDRARRAACRRPLARPADEPVADAARRRAAARPAIRAPGRSRWGARGPRAARRSIMADDRSTPRVRARCQCAPPATPARRRGPLEQHHHDDAEADRDHRDPEAVLERHHHRLRASPGRSSIAGRVEAAARDRRATAPARPDRTA